MAVEESLQFNVFEIHSNEDGEIIDLRAGTPRFEYRESVFSPYVELTAYIVDTGNTVKADDGTDAAVGLLDAGFGQGTEKIFFDIQDKNGFKVNLAHDDGADLRLASLTSSKQSFQNQTYVITAVSKEAFDNTLLGNRCRMQYSGKISDIALTILKNDLKSVKWNETYIDETLNQYHEWGQDRYPFEMLLDLQKLAIPASLRTTDEKNPLGKTAGYLFWQTWDRFHFRSLDKLFDTTDKRIKRFIENKNADPIPPEGFQGKILSSTINRNIDALADFESGARGSRIEVFNEVTKTYEAYPLTAADKGNGILAGRHLPTFNPEYDDKLTTVQRTRAAVGQNVIGHETLESQIKKTGQPNYEVENIFQQAHQNYRQKMDITIEIVIGVDLSLKAGDLIYCEFEELTTAKTLQGSKFRNSGIYMIADLCHYGDGTKAFTGLNLVRDSYGDSYSGESKSSNASSNADKVMDSNFLSFIK